MKNFRNHQNRRIDNLDFLNMGKPGLNKLWITKNINSDLLGDTLQKIAFSIDDLNNEIENYSFSPKNIVYQIVLGAWILEAVKKLPKLIKDHLVKKFIYESSKKDMADEYIKAVRSYVIAHPLSTNKHHKHGFNGDFICIDIFGPKSAGGYFVHEDRFFKLDLNGLHACDPNKCDYDYCLKSYSEITDGSKYFILIACSLDDLYKSVNEEINYIYALNTYLSKQRKKNYQ